MITIILLFVLLVIAAIFQINAARGPRRYPGPVRGTSFPVLPSPGPSSTPSP